MRVRLSESVFYNHNDQRPANLGYHIEFNDEQQWIRITPMERQADGSRILISSGEFLFSPKQLKDDHNLRSFWGPHACWALESRYSPYALSHLYPLYPLTMQHGAPHPLIHALFDRPILFYVPHREAKISEIAVLVYIHSQGFIESDRTLVRVLGRAEVEERAFPKLAIQMKETCEAGKMLVGLVRLLAPDGDDISGAWSSLLAEEIFLSADTGYLNKRRLRLRNGWGEFQFHAQGLASGDSASISAGFEFFRNKTEKLVAIN